MTIDGVNYRLTKHGRARYLERVGPASDSEIIRTAVAGMPGFRFVWANKNWRGEPREGYRLVTVIETPPR